MKNIFTLSLLFAFAFGLSAQGIEFRNLSFAEALAASKEENKPIFMDCYTTWCGPCKWMAANIFTREDIGDYYNENFICMKFDMEKGEGLDIAKKYSVRSYPTLLVLDGSGELLNLQLGAFRDPEPYIEMGETAKDPLRNIPYLVANKAANFDNPEFMQRYFMTLGPAQRLEAGELDLYFAQFPISDWTSDENWRILERNARDYNSATFQALLANEELFTNARGEEPANFISAVMYQHLVKEYRQHRKDPKAYKILKNEILSAYPKSGETAFKVELFEAETEKDWEKYCKTCVENVKTYYWDIAPHLNNIAWNFYKNTKNQEYLEVALSFARRSVELAPAAYSLDTYAHLLLATGNAEEALEAQKQAIALAHKQGEDTSEYEKLVKQIEDSLKL